METSAAGNKCDKAHFSMSAARRFMASYRVRMENPLPAPHSSMCSERSDVGGFCMMSALHFPLRGAGGAQGLSWEEAHSATERCVAGGKWIPFGDHPLKLERYRED